MIGWIIGGLVLAAMLGGSDHEEQAPANRTKLRKDTYKKRIKKCLENGNYGEVKNVFTRK